MALELCTPRILSPEHSCPTAGISGRLSTADVDGRVGCAADLWPFSLSRIWFKSRGSSRAAPGLPLSVVHCLLRTLQPSCEKGIILPILQIRKLRFREVESFVQGNTARKKRSWNSKLGHPASKAAFSTRFRTGRVQPLPEESGYTE